MSDQFIPYKDVPWEDFIKAVHILLRNLTLVADVVLGDFRNTAPEKVAQDTVIICEIAALLLRSEGSRPYQDVPQEDFIKAIHIFLLNLNHVVLAYFQREIGISAGAINLDAIGTDEEVALLLRSQKGA